VAAATHHHLISDLETIWPNCMRRLLVQTNIEGFERYEAEYFLSENRFAWFVDAVG